ncbi:MAG TPA: hypothetical protein PLJ34_00650 [Hyphomicrobiales bacterium]|nr:hypothetical protein [Kaistiaceae bacterium]HQF29930.1 hypothetical protein [Hyphomicrobiales bacterium]
MKQMLLQEKYPVFALELKKSETDMKTVDDIVEALKARIAEDERIAYIATFDHMDHTMGLGGEINPAIKDARNLVFCFGFALPSPMVLAVRPRSIGIADMGEHFLISFLEPPMEVATKSMEAWCKGLARA